VRRITATTANTPAPTVTMEGPAGVSAANEY